VVVAQSFSLTKVERSEEVNGLAVPAELRY